MQIRVGNIWDVWYSRLMGYPKGKPRTEKSKRRIRETMKRKWSRGEISLKFVVHKPHTEETKKKLSKIHTGKSYHDKGFQKGHGSFWTEDTKQKMSELNKRLGRKPPINSMPEEKHWNWKGGVTKERTQLCNTKEYRDWRKMVYERDNWTCQCCSIRGGRLEAHHIKSWAEYPDLRFDSNNGQTLCFSCHKKTYAKRV